MNRWIYCLLLLFTNVLESSPYHRRSLTHLKQEQRIKSVKRMYATRSKTNTTMQLQVNGIECDLCAQTVIDIVAKYGGQDVQVKNIANDYEACYLVFNWLEKNKNIAIAKVRQELEKEGFELVSLKGSFYGVFKTKDQKLSLSLDNGAVIAHVKSELKKTRQDKLVFTNGLLSLDAHQYVFELLL
jgi:copper chaperone CopZ